MPTKYRKMTLKHGVLEYKDNQWFKNGRPLTKDAVLGSKLKDRDYTKVLTLDGGTRVLDVDKNGNPIKPSYIGGKDKYETRENYWRQAPIVRHAVDSIANRYGIDPNLLKTRLNEEGIIDSFINRNNENYKEEIPEFRRYHSNYNVLDNVSDSGFKYYGLDDAADYILSGFVNPINERWYDGEAINENGRKVHYAQGATNKESMGLVGATLRAFTDDAKKEYPNESDYQHQVRANAYYNRGKGGAKKMNKEDLNKQYGFKRTLSGDY